MLVNKERSLGFWCSRIGHQYFALLSERLSHLGLDRGYFTLALIVDADGRVSQQELADALHMDKVAMVRSIDHLCERGFVERAACPHDRRKHHLKVLPKAKAAVKEIKQAYAALDRMALKELPAAERKQLIGLLRDALGNLQSAPERPTDKPKNQRNA
jgi:DNA-binding MarR family transcriptional regulator